jgi:hypothetical protein
VLALEGLGPGIGGVVPGVADRVTEPGRDLRLRAGDVLAQPVRLGFELLADLRQLLLGPVLLTRPDG